jgi:hypothetical protein
LPLRDGIDDLLDPAFENFTGNRVEGDLGLVADPSQGASGVPRGGLLPLVAPRYWICA